MGEPAGQHYGINIAQVIVLVPEQLACPTDDVERFDNIVLAIRSRKHDNADFGGHARPPVVDAVTAVTASRLSLYPLLQ